MSTAVAPRSTPAADASASDAEASDASAVCVTCGRAVGTPFCPYCGERRAADRRYTLGGLAAEAWEALSPTDGRGVRSLWVLVRRPGALTAAYMRGVRQPFLTPLRLFLLVNVAYFAFVSATRQNTFTTPLAVHVAATPYAGVAGPLVARRLAARRLTLANYARRFDPVAAEQAKSLVGVMVPLFALLVGGVEARRRRPAMQHLAFAFHAITVLLVAVMAVGAAGELASRTAAGSGFRVADDAPDTIASGVTVVALAAWIAGGVRVAYGESRAGSAWRAAVLTAGIVLVLNVYRVLLFFTAFWAT